MLPCQKCLIKVFLWQLCSSCVEVLCLFSFQPERNHCQLNSTPLLPQLRLQMLFFPTQALTLCLEASGWRDFAHGRSLHSSHCRSYLSLFLCLWLHLLLRLSCFLSPITLQLFSPSQWRSTKPASSSDTSTGYSGWTMTLESGFPKTLTRFKAANKLAANYLSNTCCRRR